MIGIPKNVLTTGVSKIVWVNNVCPIIDSPRAKNRPT